MNILSLFKISFKGDERTKVRSIDFENGWGVRQSDFGKQKKKTSKDQKPANRQNHSSCGWMRVGDGGRVLCVVYITFNVRLYF